MPSDQPFIIEVLDMQGRMVFSQEGVGMEGENSFPLRSGNFVPGVYVVYFQSGALKGQKRLVVQD
ncbi:MAG: T9SS type A sorting domain-containing protein [Phycisphaerae bacterium]|nr:T9SS type A sorting domain-containing protein [Saprospiraceae bacterium]